MPRMAPQLSSHVSVPDQKEILPSLNVCLLFVASRANNFDQSNHWAANYGGKTDNKGWTGLTRINSIEC